MLSVKNLIKTYPDFKLTVDSLKLSKGEIMGVIGKNGAGKTTLIKSILNLIPINSGNINVNGMDISKNRISVLQNIGYVNDAINYYESLTINQMKSFIKSFYINWDDNRFFYFIDKLSLSNCLNYKIKDLSRGMGMKFAIAIAFAHHPDLYILDEPTSGLDPFARSQVMDALKLFSTKESSGVLFSTHIIEDIEEIADSVVFINDGKIIFNNKLEDIYKKNSSKKLNRILEKYYKDEHTI